MLKPAEFQSFEQEVHRLINYYSHLLSHYPPGHERGREIQRLIDEQVDASAHVPTSCKNGCGACCHLEVEITEDDAEILADSIMDGVDIDFARLHELSQREHHDTKWQRGMVTENRCLFLDETNSCKNYENRPAVCRRHSVTSPVAECETVGGAPVPRVIPLVEIIISAAIQQPQNSYGGLSKMLQKVLERRLQVQAEHELTRDNQTAAERS